MSVSYRWLSCHRLRKQLMYLLKNTSCSESTVVWRLHSCTSKWLIYYFQCITCFWAHCMLTRLAWPHKYIHMLQYHEHTFAQLFFFRLEHSTFCVSTTALLPQAFLVSLLKKRPQRVRTHAISPSDQMIQKRLHWLYMTSFSSPIFPLCTTSHGSICFFHSLAIQQCSELSFPERFKLDKFRLTSQTVSLFKGFTYFILYYILKKWLSYPTSFSFLQSIS